jgi:hypothetical protein
MTSAKYILLFLGLIAFYQVQAQSKDYYYENQTRYGTFRNSSNGGSRLVTNFRGGTDYTDGMGAGQEEARRMTEERQRQRQIEFERMRNASNADKSNSSHTPVNDVRFETLRFSNGNTYTGNTLNGEPHGNGTVTFVKSGHTMKGEFKFGQPDGDMTITGENYVQTGKFVNGQPVGEQRYDYDDGVQKLVEIRNVDNNTSTVHYPDRTSFSGISDENGKYLKGKVKYTSGITFDGDYENGRPYRGVWENDGRVMIGEFGEVTPAQLYLKYGYHYDPKTKDQTYGSYTPDMKRIGYSRLVFADNNVQHFIYGENEAEIFVYVQFTNGNLLSLKANQDGYDYLGTYYEAATNELEPVIFSKQNGRQVIPADDPLAEKAKGYSQEVAPAINAGKQQFEDNFSQVKPYVDAYNAKSSPTLAFGNWQEASQNYDWTVLEVPPGDINVHRYLEDGVLKFKTNSKDYTWAFTALDQAKPSSYTYEAVCHTEKELLDGGAVGILIDIDEQNGNHNAKLLLMVSPEHKTYYLGVFSYATQWTSFVGNKEAAWAGSDAINGFDESGLSTNALKLEKAGDVISAFANGHRLFTLKVSESGKLLNNFAGVGIVQKGMAKGHISSVRFQMPPGGE